LFVGALGAIAGAVAAYIDLQDLGAQRTRHNTFERLANSDVVQQERKYRKSPPTDQYNTPIPPGATVSPDDEFVNNPDYKPYHEAELTKLNRIGIEKVNWTKDDEVASIEANDGALYFPGSAPSLWLYFLALTFPFLGFFIPWGLVRAVVWVGAGFFEDAK
jgi:hypothetical protein